MKKINYLICTLLLCLSFYTQADIKIGFIDGLSGPMANAGEAALNQFRAANEFFVKSRGGVLDGQSFQFIPIDNKGNAQESLVALKSATDQGIRIIVQGQTILLLIRQLNVSFFLVKIMLMDSKFP